MSDSEWRLVVRLRSRQALREAMHLHGIRSGAELARRANLGAGIVGHLLSGKRSQCSAKTARAIEEVLYRTPEPLFEIGKSPFVGKQRTGKGAA